MLLDELAAQLILKNNHETFFITTRASYRDYRSRISRDEKITEDKNADDDLINDSSEHSLQLLTLSSTLKTLYKMKWAESEDEMSKDKALPYCHCMLDVFLNTN